MLVEISLAAACLVVYLESTTLLTAVDEVLRLKSSLRTAGHIPEPTLLTLGAEVPPFSTRIVGSSKEVTERDLLGQSTVLLFVDAVDARQAPPLTMLGLIASMWNKVDGGVNIVCRGGEDECLRLVGAWRMERVDHRHVRFMLDDTGSVSNALGVNHTPAAFLIHSDGRIAKHGAPVAWPGKGAQGFLSNAAGDHHE